MVPVLPVAAPPRLTPVPAVLLTEVFAKLKFADELTILIPIPPLDVFETPVARLDIAPAMVLRLIAVALAPDEARPPEKFATEDGPVNVPVFRFKAGPVL